MLLWSDVTCGPRLLNCRLPALGWSIREIRSHGCFLHYWWKEIQNFHVQACFHNRNKFTQKQNFKSWRVPMVLKLTNRLPNSTGLGREVLGPAPSSVGQRSAWSTVVRQIHFGRKKDPISGKSDLQYLLRNIIAKCSDFKNKETALQYFGSQLGFEVLLTPKFHTELAGEGIE